MLMAVLGYVFMCNPHKYKFGIVVSKAFRHFRLDMHVYKIL